MQRNVCRGDVTILSILFPPVSLDKEDDGRTDGSTYSGTDGSFCKVQPVKCAHRNPPLWRVRRALTRR